MKTDALILMIKEDIVDQAYRLALSLTDQPIKVNYACVFTKSLDEYKSMIQAAETIGEVVKDTSMGPVYKVAPIQTIAGDLYILKIRKPDPNRKERGDADFTLTDYASFKNINITKPGFKLIKRDEFEMLEFNPGNGSALVYFSNPTLAEVLGLGDLIK